MSSTFKERVYDYLKIRLLYTVATKEHIYRTLNELIPFAEITTNDCEVSLKFDNDVVIFHFDLEPRNNMFYLKGIS